MLFTYLAFGLLPLNLQAENPPPAPKEETKPATPKPSEIPAPKSEKPPAKSSMDETIQFLKDRLKSSEATAEISATLKEDGKTMALKFYRGSTIMNVEFDPMSSDVFYDIMLKEVKPVSKDGKPVAIKGGLETDDSLRRLKERVESLEIKLDLMLEELRRGNQSPDLNQAPPKRAPQQEPSELPRDPRDSRDPRDTRETRVRETRDPLREAIDSLEAQKQQEELSARLQQMVDSLEQKKVEPPRDRTTGKTVPQEALSHIYQAQRFFYSKNYRASLKEIDRSLEQGETPLAFALKGSAHITLGEKTEALQAWQRALELDPTMTDVQNAMRFYGGTPPK